MVCMSRETYKGFDLNVELQVADGIDNGMIARVGGLDLQVVGGEAT